MARIDKDAADLVRRLRTNEGLSPEDLAREIRIKGVSAGYSAKRLSISGDTIRLLERCHHEPGPRVKFAISFYFGLRPGQIWKADELVERVAEVSA